MDSYPPEDALERGAVTSRHFVIAYLIGLPIMVGLDHLWRALERPALEETPREPVLAYLWPVHGLPTELALGIGAGLAVVLVELLLRARMSWIRDLEHLFWGLLGKPRIPHCLGLALASGLAEEVLFRGVLQPRFGLILTSALFGLLHMVTWQYALYAGLLGLVLGYLHHITGQGLLAPVACHVTINAIGLILLSRSCPANAPAWQPDDTCTEDAT